MKITNNFNNDFAEQERQREIKKQEHLLHLAQVNSESEKFAELERQKRINEQLEATARQMERTPRFGMNGADAFRQKHGLPSRAEQEEQARQAEDNKTINDLLKNIRIAH